MTKLSPRGLVLTALAAAALLASVTACSTGTLGITNFDDLGLSGDLTVGDDATIGDDLAVSGDLTVTGALNATVDVDGTTLSDITLDGLTVTGVMTNTAGLSHIRFPSYATASFTYTSAAGGTVVLWTVPDNQTWLIHNILVKITQSFNATGNDEDIWIGDANDEDGFCQMVGSEADQNYAPFIGASSGWSCGDPLTRGAYLDPAVNIDGFIMDDPGAFGDIYMTIDETSGATLSQGAGTAYIWYTRIQ